MKRKPFKLRRWLVLGVAAGALSVSAAAQARTIIDVGGDVPAAVSAQTRYWTAVDQFYKSHAVDTVGSGTVPVAQPVPVTGGSDGFGWSDFAVGIGAAFGAMLAAAGIAQVARNRRRLATLH